jgi:predicted enzyme related to lactoylglutathione lyase
MTGGAVVYVKHLDAAVDFYSRVTSLPVARHEDGYAMLGTPPAQLVLHQIPAPIAESIVIARPPVRREDTPVKLVFLVPSIDRARDAAAALGGAVDGNERSWRLDDCNLCDGHDPEGNVFQLREPAA